MKKGYKKPMLRLVALQGAANMLAASGTSATQLSLTPDHTDYNRHLGD